MAWNDRTPECAKKCRPYKTEVMKAGPKEKKMLEKGIQPAL